ncbi:MAG: T9SS type A sorting domain-containing protein [Barnesiella sp.]
MKKLFVLSCALFLCVLMPLSAQIKVNQYGATYVGSYGSNPDAQNSNYDIPGLYVYGANDYPAIYCKPGSIGLGMKIDGSKNINGPLLFLQGNNTANITLVQAYGVGGLCFSLTGEGVVSANNYITYTPKSNLKNGEMFKKIDSPLEKLMKLNGILYQSSVSETSGDGKQMVPSSKYRIGLRSEEVQSVVPEVVYTTQEGETGIAYNELVGLLIEAMKEQQATISELQAAVNELKSPSTIESQASDNAALLQNVPNPFDKETRIGYTLPSTVSSAQLLVYDLQGNQLKNIPVISRGKGEVVIQASELSAGMYVYTLLADGKEVATKRMILTK